MKPMYFNRAKSLMKMLIKCCLPFALVEHPAFIEYHKTLDPCFKVPCRSTMSGAKLAELKLEVELKIKRLFADEMITVNTSVDGWSDDTARCFNGYIGQFIDMEWKLNTIPFAFEYVSGKQITFLFLLQKKLFLKTKKIAACFT